MSKIWLVISRRRDGFMAEKVKIFGTIEQAKYVGELMIHTKCIKYEIYEDGKDYVGDYRAKPVYTCEMKNEIQG